MQWAVKLQKKEAHISERPVAQLTSVLFNVNRGKKTKPIKPTDLYLYADAEDLNLPEGRYGRSMQAAIDAKLFPSWALFVYKELAQSAAGVCPDEYIAICEDVCILAPEVSGTVLKGLVIAHETASRKVRQVVSPSGTVYTIRLPEIPRKYVASEEWDLELLAVNQA